MPGQHRRPLSAIVPAAGEGKRMRSGTPKVLHPLCGRPMVLHTLDVLAALPLDRIVVVVGHRAEEVAKTIQEQLVTDVPVEFVEQTVQRGTGDAVAVGLTAFSDVLDGEDDVIVVFGDAPLLRSETLAMLATEHRFADAAATLLTARVDDPTSYGRVVRDAGGHVDRIVEEPDATPEELAIDEVNPSIYCFRRGLLAPALRRLVPENAQGEYYLTDVIEVLHQAGHLVEAIEVDDPVEVAQVNDRAQLAVAERELRARINERWMRAGVTMVDPARTYIDATVQLDADVRLLPGTILQGHTVVRSGSVIGPDVQFVDTVVGHDAVVRQTVAVEAELGDRVTC
ncbi:MAG TPA: sugar phosphate nucleotidyltransferase, partial [Acidimicrobiia bacterium]